MSTRTKYWRERTADSIKLNHNAAARHWRVYQLVPPMGYLCPHVFSLYLQTNVSMHGGISPHRRQIYTSYSTGIKFSNSIAGTLLKQCMDWNSTHFADRSLTATAGAIYLAERKLLGISYVSINLRYLLCFVTALDPLLDGGASSYGKRNTMK